MPIGQSTFTADNIVALLTEAPKGGTVEQVVERAGVQVAASAVKKWVNDGKRDREAGKDTAYRLFAAQWEASYPGAPPRGEAERMAEMKKALEKMGIQAPPEPPQNGRRRNGSTSGATRAPRGSSKTCECGNEKDPNAAACASWVAIDSRARGAA